MKNIEIEDDLYAYIASQTQHIGETASDILRRLVMPEKRSLRLNQALQQKLRQGMYLVKLPQKICLNTPRWSSVF